MIETIHFTNDSKNTNMHPLKGRHNLYANKADRIDAAIARVCRSGPEPGARNTWEPLRYLVGSWEGTGNGQPGQSKIQREY
jgi:hypothetical protein